MKRYFPITGCLIALFSCTNNTPKQDIVQDTTTKQVKPAALTAADVPGPAAGTSLSKEYI
jgi:hypothetical protein